MHVFFSSHVVNVVNWRYQIKLALGTLGFATNFLRNKCNSAIVCKFNVLIPIQYT